MKVQYIVDLVENAKAGLALAQGVPELRRLGIEPEFVVFPGPEGLGQAGFAVDAPCCSISHGKSAGEMRRDLRKLAEEAEPRYIHNLQYMRNLMVWRSCTGSKAMLIGSAELPLAQVRSRLSWWGTLLNCALPNIQVFPDGGQAAQITQFLPKMLWPWILQAQSPGTCKPQQWAEQFAHAYDVLKGGNQPKWKKP